MSREDIKNRDRLLLLAEAANPHKPLNVKRKSILTKQGSKQGSKLSMQDFVRMDPGYTPDIEHLVFHTRKRNPQQVAPINPPTPATTQAKTRSRLAEMFALSRHLEQRSADRERERDRSIKPRNLPINRSVDSVLESNRQAESARRWVSAAEEPVQRQNANTNSRISPAEEADMAAAGNRNISVLHLRGTSEPWELSPTTSFPSRSFFPNKSAHLTKHQSLGSSQYDWVNSPSFHSGGEVNSPNIILTGSNCNRELSPVRWCDREVDGVYLNRSGWVQVQQRSLDENRRMQTNRLSTPKATNSLQTRKSKLADLHCVSEPGQLDPQRPAYLSLQKELKVTPPHLIPESYSPPSLTPILSPPPAFQDKASPKPKRTFFGGKSFLHRSNAVEDSDGSPPGSPVRKFKSLAPQLPPMPPRLTQTKSEDQNSKRLKFVQRRGESSSSSSSSMGFRSLDSTFNRSIMPRLSENTDSSVDVYEDADEEDNNSSSITMSLTPVSTVPVKHAYHRTPPRRSPAGSDTNKTLTCSPSSSSSDETFMSPQQFRKAVNRHQKPEETKVRRSRSLQLPERSSKATSPHDYRPGKASQLQKLDQDLMREAEVVAGFVYGNRSRAAAQALLMHRYNNSIPERSDPEPAAKPNNLTVYYVGNKNDKQRILVRGATTPTLPISKHGFSESHSNWNQREAKDNYGMKSSQSYPMHQRSLDSGVMNVKKQEARRRDVRVKTGGSNVSGSSSGGSEGYVSKLCRSSGGSTPLDEVKEVRVREMILTRPGSAPAQEERDAMVEAQQRSMSLPKSFLSAGQAQSGQLQWRRNGTESLGSSPGCQRKVPTPETVHTAPVTPLHEGARRRSPVGVGSRRAKATSTPQLLEQESQDIGNWVENPETKGINPSNANSRRSVHGQAGESVLQKFRKTLSLRFQKKGSKDSCQSDIDPLSEIPGESYGDDSPVHIPQGIEVIKDKDDFSEQEQKHRFGPLVWRSSKERKMNKAARSAKCNSGDSGIQIEMVSGCGGACDSSESHDTDPTGEGDSPPALRKRQQQGRGSRPHSDLINQILIDKFKSDLKQRAHKHQHVRRTRSDLGGQRLLHWDPRSSYRRFMSSSTRQSPRRKPPEVPGVQMRHVNRRTNMRRSLSQPLDIDKLSPLMRHRNLGIKPNVLSEDDNPASSDEEISDSEASVASLERKKSLELAMDDEMVILAEAVFDHVAIEAEELAFRAGDVIEVLETANRDWWWGSCRNRCGWFPAQFVRLRVSQEDTVEDCLAAIASGKSLKTQIRRRTSISLLSNDQVRTSVVRELVHTERDFVKVLQDVAEGYISECRKRKDMFDEAKIQTIFINLEDILKFQQAFLKDLEACIEWEAPYKSCIGKCFLKHKQGFKMYSDYCNSHPMATASLQELYQFNNYSKFFEACRLMRGLIEIPLDGYLLTPVQRICKYPLQLAELLKYTKPQHEDYEEIKEALEVMRSVAVLINERKRRMESLEKLAAWQQRVEGWEGDDLIELSSQLIYQDEVVRVTNGMWSNNITLFLFDHQILYCKKDILKRNSYVYKGRICLDTCEVIDVPDGKDVHLGVNVKHAIKLYSCVRDKWLLFCCRSASDKQRWLKYFAEERQLVAQDKSDGLEFPPAARQLARLAAKCQRRPPRKPHTGKNFKYGSAYALHTSNNSNSLGRKVGTWFTFNKKSRHRHREVP